MLALHCFVKIITEFSPRLHESEIWIKFYLGENFQYAFKEDKIPPWRFHILF